MRLLWVELDRFRNLDRQKVELHPRYNLLIGENGQGKTNFLEAVSYLGTLKSFRNATRKEMVRHEEEVCRVSGCVLSGGVKHDVAFALTRKGRTQYLDDQKIQSPESYLGVLRLVSFIPEDVGLASGSPSWRRRVIDRSVFEVDSGYVAEYRKYLSVLRQRNTLLRNKRFSSEELASWTNSLVAAGAILVGRRQSLIASLGPPMTGFGRRFGLGDDLGLAYHPSFDWPEPALVDKGDAGQIKKVMASELSKMAQREESVGHTLVGPHRDNVVFTVGGQDVGRFGSQGQKRSAVLALKLAMGQVISLSSGSHPVILLDDVASELDNIRRRVLGEVIRETRAQFFISTTSEESGFLNRTEGFVFEVRNGVLSRLK